VITPRLSPKLRNHKRIGREDPYCGDTGKKPGNRGIALGVGEQVKWELGGIGGKIINLRSREKWRSTRKKYFGFGRRG